jgi:hypothetical protein
MTHLSNSPINPFKHLETPYKLSRRKSIMQRFVKLQTITQKKRTCNYCIHSRRNHKNPKDKPHPEKSYHKN